MQPIILTVDQVFDGLGEVAGIASGKCSACRSFFVGIAFQLVVTTA